MFLEKIQWWLWDVVCFFVRRRSRQEKLWYFLNRHVRMVPTYTIGVVVVVTYRYDVLLVCKRRGPRGAEWVLPGGGVERREKWYQAAARELYEETGIEARFDILKWLGTALDEENRDIVVAFWYRLEEEVEPEAGDTMEISGSKFMYIDDAREVVSKPEHKRIIQMAKEQVFSSNNEGS